MTLPANPPKWLKSQSARNAWRQCVLYESSIPKREIELITGYCEAISSVIDIPAMKSKAGRQLDEIILRGSWHTESDASMRAKLSQTLHRAQNVQNATKELRQLGLAIETSLMNSLPDAGPALRSLILPLVAAGNPVLAKTTKNESNSRSIVVRIKGKG